MTLPQQKQNGTYADYLAWDGENRMEIMDGQVIMMAPPSRLHQKISGEIFRQLANFLDGKKCEVYAAPFAVRLFADREDLPAQIQTVFEPDIAVICDKSKLDDQGCLGAPDMVVEILSPSTARNDLIFKKSYYQEAGVREYWVVSPKDHTVQVFTAVEGYKLLEVYNDSDIAGVTVLPGCFIELAKVFTDN